MARAVSTRTKVSYTVAAWVVALLIFFPILYTIITSLKSEPEAIAGFNLIPSFTFESYREVQNQSNYIKPFMNSVILAVGSTVLGLDHRHPLGLGDGLLAHQAHQGRADVDALDQDDAGRRGAGADLPALHLDGAPRHASRHHHRADAHQPADHHLDALHLLPRDPGEILEAARMDGASLWGEIWNVLTPMAIPGIASTLLLNIILAWNESFWTILLTTTNAAPLTAFIASFSSPQGLFWAKLSAASVMAIAPILIMGWFSQKQLVRGLTFGAVK